MDSAQGSNWTMLLIYLVHSIIDSYCGSFLLFCRYKQSIVQIDAAPLTIRYNLSVQTLRLIRATGSIEGQAVNRSKDNEYAYERALRTDWHHTRSTEIVARVVFRHAMVK